MTIPTYDKCIEPLLRYIAAHPGGVATLDAYEAAINPMLHALTYFLAPHPAKGSH